MSEHVEQRKPQTYYSKVFLDSDIELYEAFIKIHCMKEVMSNTGKLHDLPSDQLIRLLAIYLKFGYSRDTRHYAKELFGLKDIKRIDFLNHQLTKFGFLYSPSAVKQDKELNESLQGIEKYLKSNVGGPVSFSFVFSVKS